MQEDKKKKIKKMLGRLLTVVILLAISVATYKVNLSELLHDFVLRFYNAGMSQKTEATVLQEENITCFSDVILKTDGVEV